MPASGTCGPPKAHPLNSLGTLALKQSVELSYSTVRSNFKCYKNSFQYAIGLDHLNCNSTFLQ